MRLFPQAPQAASRGALAVSGGAVGGRTSGCPEVRRKAFLAGSVAEKVFLKKVFLGTHVAMFFCRRLGKINFWHDSCMYGRRLGKINFWRDSCIGQSVD